MESIINKSLELRIAVSEEERNRAIQFLEINNLPTSDIDEDKLLYLLWEDGQPIGTGGLEIFDDCGLLRSVTVISEKQNAGYGSFIIQQLERFAFDSGISCMYLLTNTAEKFFDRKGYCKISRENVPDTIKRTSEYSELCPSTAVVMNKVLS